MSLCLVGRTEEQEILQASYDSNGSEFIAIYGRRRIGKTFLVKQFFEKKKCHFFNITGIHKGEITEQTHRFVKEIGRVFYKGAPLKEEDNWYNTFDLLMDAIHKFVTKKQKIVLFFDEFPWMATHRSKLLSVVEYFWNQHWSTDPRIKLIICGSSASWIINKIINNKGGLHNRITRKIHLSPFTLTEVKTFLAGNGIKLNNNQVTQLYMVTGGIPYYLSQLKKGHSATQLIENLAFKKNSLLFKEFDNLLSSLFEDANPYIEILKTIAKYRYGVGQHDIIKEIKFSSSGGGVSRKLTELEASGFIISFTPYRHKKRGLYYRLIDEYSQFYIKWIEPIRNTLQKESVETGYWEKIHGSPSWNSWSGYAFESICYKHITKIRSKLDISPSAIAHAWRYTPKVNSTEKGAQIDLLFDRNDDVITLCEIKYSDKPFTIDKQYAINLKNKEEVFSDKTKTKKQIFIAMIAANGITDNYYAQDLVSGVITLEDLFE